MWVRRSDKTLGVKGFVLVVKGPFREVLKGKIIHDKIGVKCAILVQRSTGNEVMTEEASRDSRSRMF